MNIVSYNNLKLKYKSEIKEIKIGDTTVGVLQYLPSQDKYDLLMSTLQKSYEDGYYNDFLCDVYFHLHLVYMYTNLSFTQKQREDELKLYDVLETNGVIDLVVSAMNEDEYNNLKQYIDFIRYSQSDHNHSIGSIVSKVISDLPKQAAEAAKILENFNPEQYKNVIQLAQKAGYKNAVDGQQ